MPTRRSLLLGTGAVVLGGALALGRKGDRGGAHDSYFTALATALRRARIAQPVLVIDRERLQQNIAAAQQTLSASRLPLRVVVKSLPAPRLIETIASGLRTERYMVFNGSMLQETARLAPQGDLLLGKPLPVAAAREFYDVMRAQQRPFAEPQWLIDSVERLEQYAQMAGAAGHALRVNLEIDVGLHRGGARNAEELAALIDAASAKPWVRIAGLMGYDAHVPKVPGVERAYRASQTAYAQAIELLRSRLGAEAGPLTFNAAGSPTYSLHARARVANEVSVGSAFVKPTDFDTATLEQHVPAAFIATPVVKALDRAQVPGLGWLGGVRAAWDANAARAFYIYGGHWLAQPVSPPGLQFSSLMGRSSNQELLLGSNSVALQPDDYVFFRPTQSEAVLLQFGDLLVYEGGEISDRWPTFPVSA